MIELYKKIFEKTQKFQPLELEMIYYRSQNGNVYHVIINRRWAFNCPNCVQSGP